MRLFVAVELDESIRAAAGSAGQALRSRLPHDVVARWVPEENIHVTLWFLGEVEEARVAAVLAALESPFDLQPFSMSLDGLGAFPPSGAPRVLWLGVGRGAAELRMLHGRLSARLEPLGFARERRPYSAHVTLARVKDLGSRRSQVAVRRVLAEAVAPVSSSPVKAVTLFRSRLSPKGASYEPVLRVPLNG